MKRLVLIPLFLSFLFPSHALPQTIIPGGPVSGAWTLAGSPYLVRGEITLESGNILSIEPGVTVEFQGWYKFIVWGMLQAVGTQEDTITFTAADTSEGWHGLRFYDLNTQADSSRLVYCKLSYGRSSSDNSAWENKHGGVIFASDSDKLLISHCLLAYNQTGDVVGHTGAAGTSGIDPGDPGENVSSGNGGAICLINSNILIFNNLISSNKTGNATGGTGGEGFSYSGYQPYGSDGGSGGNGISGSGGALYGFSSSPVMQNNQFIENMCGAGVGGDGGWGGSASTSSTAGWAAGGNGGLGGDGTGGAGGAIFLTNSITHMKNNLIVDCFSGPGQGGTGGAGGSADSPSLGTSFGGSGGDGGTGTSGHGASLCLDSTSLVMSNLTVHGNRCGDANPGAGGEPGAGWYWGSPGSPGMSVQGTYTLYANDENQVTISNSIIWESTTPSLQNYHDVTYSCFQDVYPGSGNLTADPLFVSIPAQDFFLSQINAGQVAQSPCVDAGDPDSTIIEGTTRTDGLQDEGVIDMGYHHTCFTSGPVLRVEPTILTYDLAFGGPNPDDRVIHILNYGTGIFNYQVLEYVDWIEVFPISGGPVPPIDSVTVSVDISSLMPGLYEEDIIINAPGAVGDPDTVSVTLELGEAILSASEDTLYFAAQLGGSNPDDQTVEITNAGSGTLEYVIDYNSDWLTVTPGGGGPLPPSVIETISVDISGITTGIYEDDIIVNPASNYGIADTVHVRLDIYYNPISGNLTGILGPGSYTVVDNIFVTGELVVEPGTMLSFAGPFSFSVIGSLQAIGTEEDSICFSSLTEYLPWYGIRFYGSGTMEYCQISDADSMGIRIESSNPVFRHCLISDNSAPGNTWAGGVYSDDSSPEFYYCTFSENFSEAGGGFGCLDSSPSLHSCLFINNLALFAGGAVYSYQSTTLFDSCLFIENSVLTPLAGSYIGGGGVKCYDDNSEFRNCTFSGNSVGGSTTYLNGGGLYLYRGTYLLDHCVFSQNIVSGSHVSGGGFFCDCDSVRVINCSFAGNELEGEYTNGAGACLQYTSVSITNSIFENNTEDAVYIHESIVDVWLSYNDFYNNPGGNFTGAIPPNLGVLTTTNANDDSCDMYYNIFLDPLFVDPDSGDYHLQEDSPCIDAGDPESPLDPDSTIADIGAFYYPHLATNRPDEGIIPSSFVLYPSFPNPFNPVTSIRFGLPTASHVILEIYNLQGRKVAAIVDGFRQPGYHEVTFEATDFASGLFFARLTTPDFSAIQKLILVK